MKITRIEAIPVRVPLKKGMSTKTAHGEHVVSEYAIVRVFTDDGLIGLGEATVAPRWTGETSASCVATIDQLIGPALVGADPLDITRARQTIDLVVKQNPFTKAAVEMALWDLLGKATNSPIYRLLGGKVREEAPIKMVIGAFESDRVRSLAEQFLTWGLKCLKVKVGLVPDEDVARVALVREIAGPDIPITVDANCGWNVTSAKQTLARLERLGVIVAEQPIAPDDPEALAWLRTQTTIPIMADESVFTLADAFRLAKHRAVDVLAIYPGKHGGIAGAVEICHVAKAAGMRCAIGSNLELGIGTAAMLHVAMAMPEVDSDAFPADLIGPLYHEADLITEPLSLGPAAARVPDGPGLGVELDLEQLERFRAG
jgi:L-alanine-DL-glutamate epimerase-like enolase superfamily enzyme